MNEIINVALDADGNVTYRITPCALNTEQYGRVFATLLIQVGRMFELESDGKMSQGQVMSEISRATFGALKSDLTEHPTMNVLQ